MKIIKLTGTITLSSRIQTRVADKCIVPMWYYDWLACPQMVVQWYKSLVKASMNQTNVLESSTAVVKERDKDQGSWVVNKIHFSRVCFR